MYTWLAALGPRGRPAPVARGTAQPVGAVPEGGVAAEAGGAPAAEAPRQAAVVAEAVAPEYYAAPLPPSWHVVWSDGDAHFYFWNEETGEVTWDRPEE